MFIVTNERHEIVARTPLLAKAAQTALDLQRETGGLHQIKPDDSVTHIASGFGPVRLVHAVRDALLGTFGGA